MWSVWLAGIRHLYNWPHVCIVGAFPTICIETRQEGEMFWNLGKEQMLERQLECRFHLNCDWYRVLSGDSFGFFIAEGRVQNLALKATPKKLLVGETLYLECRAETFINGRIELIWTSPSGKVSWWKLYSAFTVSPYAKGRSLHRVE